MQLLVNVKSGRGGVRVGAGRKPTGNYKTVPVRIDARLLPLLEIIKARGVDDDLLTKIRTTLTREDESIDVVTDLKHLYDIQPKNFWCDVTKKINEACDALGFGKVGELKSSDTSALNSLTTQQHAVMNWHKGLRK